MKKLFIRALSLSAMFVSVLIVHTNAAVINLYSPTESEIMPTRDFYIVGSIDREGKSAKAEPLNIKIELINSKGEAVRTLESNVAPDGLTSGLYHRRDYEYGSVYNDPKGSYINSFTPPDIMYDGNLPDSIRFPHTKIVVRENYFSAIIYGGATKDIELKYEDRYEKALTDITQGTYELKITAVNADGEEVCGCNRILTFGSDKERVISAVDISEFANENDMVQPSSVVGLWSPVKYNINNTNGFYYCIPNRLLGNLGKEYGESKKVNLLLNYIDISDTYMNMMLGSVFSEKSEADVSYMYYDIGDDIVTFDLAGTKLEAKGNILRAKYTELLEICRVEHLGAHDEDIRIDFDTRNGVVLTEGKSSVFYGVYSPYISSVNYLSGSYKINDRVARIKAVIVNEKDEILYEDTMNASLAREDGLQTSYFEFGFTIKPNNKMLNAESLTLTFYATDKDGSKLFSSDDISLKLVKKGNFIAGYDNSYWGRIFCDSVNSIGQSPKGEALNPDDAITRGDFAAMVNSLMGYSAEGKSKFSDLEENSVFYSDCITAQQIGYMSGDDNGRVNADELISREEAIIILSRISGAEKIDNTVTFKDEELISFWAKDYVYAMCSVGVVSGFDGYINPQSNITVSEAAALIIKTIKWMYSEDEILPSDKANNFVADDSMSDFSDVDISTASAVLVPTEENIVNFFTVNFNAFKAVADYIKTNFPDGIYIGKVGGGLEIRDYKTGKILTVSPEAIDVLTKMSSYFISFSVKCNPSTGGDIYFSCGRNENGKDMGIAYSDLADANGKAFESISGDWYFYSQK